MGGAQAGILFPKTRTRIADQDNTPQFRDKDNKFYVAGMAGSLDIRLSAKIQLKNGATFYLEPAARGVAGKVNHALISWEDNRGKSLNPSCTRLSPCWEGELRFL